MSAKDFASVILEAAVDKTFDYSIPHELKDHIRKGVAVDVPVRGSIRRGYVMSVKNEAEIARVLPIHAVACDGLELISDELFELALWIAKYYCCSLGKVIRTMLPAGVRNNTEVKAPLEVKRTKSKAELIKAITLLRTTASSQALVLDYLLKVKKSVFLSELLEQTGCSRSPIDALVGRGLIELKRVYGGDILHDADYFRSKNKILKPEQQLALQKIIGSLDSGSYETHLLYGVTGSGKTEVYLQAIEACLKRGKSALILVPEIALTTQTYERFRSRFEEPIALLHHRVSAGERSRTWQAMRNGEIKLAIGARSAVFAPLQNLGLIVVDEEHEPSYKQAEEMPTYHARDVAIMRGYFTKATVVLGSATPSLESYFNAQQKKSELTVLSKRQGSGEMALVEVVDMKKALEKSGGSTLFSELLLDGIKKRVALGEQTIIFLNRRGYHTTQLCSACSYVAECPHCAVSLAFHHSESTLSCHLCGYKAAPFRVCPSCQKTETLRYKGSGTELAERALHAIFPDIRTLRIDADTTRHKGSHEKLIRDFRTGKADVLIGTQMVAKGLHFPCVTLVGILNGDASLSVPDFRSSENAFQLLTQVAGRSGRHFSQGQVIIQSFNPSCELIKLAAAQDFPTFFEKEIDSRKTFDYPPYIHLTRLLFSGLDRDKTFKAAVTFWDLLAKEEAPFELNPVIAAGHAKIKDKYRFHIILRGPRVYPMNEAILSVVARAKTPSTVSLHIDVDPLNTFF